MATPPAGPSRAVITQTHQLAAAETQEDEPIPSPLPLLFYHLFCFFFLFFCFSPGVFYLLGGACCSGSVPVGHSRAPVYKRGGAPLLVPSVVALPLSRVVIVVVLLSSCLVPSDTQEIRILKTLLPKKQIDSNTLISTYSNKFQSVFIWNRCIVEQHPFENRIARIVGRQTKKKKSFRILFIFNDIVTFTQVKQKPKIKKKKKKKKKIVASTDKFYLNSRQRNRFIISIGFSKKREEN